MRFGRSPRGCWKRDQQVDLLRDEDHLSDKDHLPDKDHESGEVELRDEDSEPTDTEERLASAVRGGFRMDTYDNAAETPKCVVPTEHFDWGDDAFLRRALVQCQASNIGSRISYAW